MRYRILGAVALVAASPGLAQSNPFVRPSSGLSKAQIQEIVRSEVTKAKSDPSRAQAGSPSSGAPRAPGVPGGAPGVDNLPQQQGGTPRANVASNAPQGPGAPVAAAAPDDVVAMLIKDGGSFVGCVGPTPIYRDRDGRRAYFTTKELRESYEARRFARCR